MAENPAHIRPLAVAFFANEISTTPTKVEQTGWGRILDVHRKRELRTRKSGSMLGGYAIKGIRNNANVPYRSIIQLDIDSKGTKDPTTGRLLQVANAAPTIDKIQAAIGEYEWCAASSHWHEPNRGVTKYRIVMLPDRDIQPDEYVPLLEAIDEAFGGNVLDRDAWQWSLAFYLPSCPEENKSSAFFRHNSGVPLPVDLFVARGRSVIQAKNGLSPIKEKLFEKTVGNTSSPENAESVDRLQRALFTLDPDMDRAAWRNVCWAIAAHGWHCGYGLAQDWSQKGEKWDATEFERVWNSFDAQHPNGVGVGSVYHYAKEAGWVDTTSATGSIRNAWESLNDAGNGDRLLKAYGTSLAYVADSGRWLIRHQNRWHHDKKGNIFVLATNALRSIYREAESYAAISTDLADATSKHAGRSLRAGGIEAAIKLAATATSIAITSDQLDADNYLFGVRNGVLDLRTGTLRDEQREDWITRSARVAYDPSAKSPIWTEFLDRIMAGDRALIDFLQTLAGYCLTGDTREQKFFFFYGGGANGKSTFLNILREMMGGYAVQARTEVLMQARGGTQAHGHTADIMPLIGARMAAANETEEGQRLAESLIKQVTGGEPIMVRSPYGRESVLVMPQFKVIVAGNHRPIIRGTDHGIWRRLVCVPFTVTFREDQQDKQLMDKLRTEFPGILNWALEGCLRWQAHGLSLPSVLESERKAYMTEMDVLQRWLDECCEIALGHECGVRVAYTNFNRWATAGGYSPVTETRFAQQIKDKGFDRNRRRTGSVVIGLRPRENEFA